MKVWTDGQKESDEIVSEWTSSFKALTASTREELEEMKASADAAGYTSVSDQLVADIATLDSLDAVIERLLKKRQNGYFSESDQIRLQELIDTREAIEIKYKLSPADVDGFDTIGQKVEAEVARAQARGKKDADASVYENAIVAAAEGLAAVNAEIDEQYDKEYALIQLIEDSSERQAALDALNAKYNEDRRNAALEYAALLADIVMPVWEQEDIQQAATDVDLLTLAYDGVTTEIDMGIMIKVAPPFMLSVDRRKRHNILICGANGRMCENITVGLQLGVLRNTGAQVIEMDGEWFVSDNFEDSLSSEIASIVPGYRCCTSRKEIVIAIKELHDEYLRRKNEGTGKPLFVFIRNLQYIDIVQQMLKDKRVMEEDYIPAAPVENTGSSFDFGQNYGIDSGSVSEKLLAVINDGASYGIFMIVSCLEFQTVKDCMYL